MKEEIHNRHLNEFNYFKKNIIKMNKNKDKKILKCSSDIPNTMATSNNQDRSKIKKIKKIKFTINN